ncbi:hypothetical protein EON66_04255 [archaeon]|nr:MAG: hypothetical protein EON66_04255 [archaeon]
MYGAWTAANDGNREGSSDVVCTVWGHTATCNARTSTSVPSAFPVRDDSRSRAACTRAASGSEVPALRPPEGCASAHHAWLDSERIVCPSWASVRACFPTAVQGVALPPIQV